MVSTAMSHQGGLFCYAWDLKACCAEAWLPAMHLPGAQEFAGSALSIMSAAMLPSARWDLLRG